ncbi:MAG: homocysteine S-methyltransferase [Propionibacteriaceae bacterium]|nr:homocysteine S-methyltransferase [Propionibacteriaceae bacterium]
MITPLPEALGVSPVVLDGGLATQLESQGHNLDSALWSARLLRDDPDAIMQAHLAYFTAGAQVATTASYQASLGGFARAGISRAEAEQLIRRSVRLAEQARTCQEDGKDRWIAGSVGPYGAALADGSEYRGDYNRSVDELRAWHRPRIALLAEAGVDILALETIPCLAEVEALLAEVDGSRQPCWLSITCTRDRTRAGEPAAAAFSLARDVEEIVAVGVNCIDPADAYPLVRSASEASGKPAVIYPNSGERWDSTARTWTGPKRWQPKDVTDWISGGARLVGGCCRVGPAEIQAIGDLVR